MTLTLPASASAGARPAISRPARPPGLLSAALVVARRALLKYLRTPALSVLAIVQAGMFLFSFRYVFGGAIHAGAGSYANFLVPGYVATLMLFTGGGIAVAVAEDKTAGFTDRLLSLPVPRLSLVLGRALADFATNAWSITTTVALGFAFGFRLTGTIGGALAALGLCLAYALVFTVVFIVMGLYAPSAQAAQGMSLIAFVFAFISSAYVPAASMPGWLQPFSRYQPLTPMVDAVRSLLAGGSSDVGLALLWSAALLVVFTPVAVIRYRRA
jgi:ABC-2 type transport system permease protein